MTLSFSPTGQARRKAAVAFVALLALPSIAGAQGSDPLVLAHANVVDVLSGAIRRDVDILIQGGRISTIEPAGRPTRHGERVVDLHGAYVAPGLLDMHAHPLDSLDPAGSLQLMLAEGVTGVRQMSGSPDLLQRRREGRLLPTADAPAILAMPGTILTRANAGDAATGVAEVDRQHDAGADFVKEIDLPPPVFFPVAAETRRLATTFAGHLSPSVDVRQASAAGMRSIEHLGPRDSILLGCSSQEAELRASLPPPASHPPVPAGPRPTPQQLEGLIRRALINPILATSPSDFPRYDSVLDTLSPAKCDELAAEFKRNQTWQVPTLIRLRTMELADDPAYLTDPDLAYAPPEARREWSTAVEQFKRQVTPDERRSLQRLFKAQLDLVARFHLDGVPMMAGSDFGGGLEVAGFSLHQELDLLAQAGLTPLQVLQAATLSGARFLNASDHLGQVRPGYDADLVVLQGDPVASVGNLHRIAGVVRGGRFYSRDDLDQLLEIVRARYARPPTAATTSSAPQRASQSPRSP